MAGFKKEENLSNLKLTSPTYQTKEEPLKEKEQRIKNLKEKTMQL